jgi:vanillate O-demethylase monooxygenase subunit
MNYLRNTWYVAAWGHEIEPGQLLARTLLDTPVVLFRDDAGRPVALLDRCPHRFAPLSAGHVDQGIVICGYHGLGFAGSGACARNPHGPVLRNISVPSFAAHEAHRAIWIWMGDQDRADPALIPDLAYLASAQDTAFSCGNIVARGNYEIFVDNIMDLSHTDYLHPTTLGGAGITGTKPKIVEAEHYIDATWFAANTRPSPLLAALFPDLPPVTDFWQRVRWFAPGVMRLTAATVAAGGAEDDALANLNAHILTPETPTSSHYFFAATRNYGAHDAALNERIATAREHIFGTEDKPMIELVQQRMGDAGFWSLKPLLLSIDSAAVRVRRRLAKLIEAEIAVQEQSAEVPS